MRLGGSKWQQIVLISVTIVCALALGYVTALFTGSDVTSTLATDQPPGSTTADPVASTEALLSPTRRATTTPAPTATLAVPTATATARATPTITTTVVATPQDELFIVENFDASTSGFPKRETETWSAGVVDGRYQLRLNGQTSIGFTTPLPADNYRLSVDLAVDEGGAGLVFLFAKPATTFRILITPDGSYTLERQNDVETTKLVDWTESTALRSGPGTVNRLEIERRGDKVRFYANDELLTEYAISDGAFENRYGFVLTSRNGQGQASFDRLRGVQLPDF